jgi:hypothetical protein
MWIKIDLHHLISRPDRSTIRSFMRAADSATKCRETADFDTPCPAVRTSPSGAAPLGGISASIR